VIQSTFVFNAPWSAHESPTISLPAMGKPP
jgi:hypothetical protein